MKPNLRVRLTGSMYTTNNSLSNTLYGGDRAGSRYYYVAREHRGDRIRAVHVGQHQSRASGTRSRRSSQPVREVRRPRAVRRHRAGRGQGVGRGRRPDLQPAGGRRGLPLLPGDDAATSARATTRSRASWPASPATSRRNRWQFGAGLFLTPGLLIKAEYVNQEFDGLPRHTTSATAASSTGMMLEGVVAF